jgi:hypothetical protein
MPQPSPNSWLSSFHKLDNFYYSLCFLLLSVIMAIFLAVSALKLGRKCCNYINGLSDSLSFALTNMPSPQGITTNNPEDATHKAATALADPAVPNNAGLVSTAAAACMM